MSEYTVSVRALVERVLIGGDLSSGGSIARMLEGARGHRRLQGEAGEQARSEVSIALEVHKETISLKVQGRIDLLWLENGLPVCVEEIKTTRGDPSTIGEEDYPLHWAQADCYAHALCVQYDLERIAVRLTYLKADGSAVSRMTRTRTSQELKARFQWLAEQYIDQLAKREAWVALRDESIRRTGFPFPQYRPGQRQMAAQAYVAIRDGQRLLAEAPTGIGKSAAMLFAALKAMGEGHIERLFYLTARGTTQQAAEDALGQMAEQGLRVRSITLAAKDKMCACPGTACNPVDCPRALGHYDRFPAALEEALQQDRHTPQDIREHCDRHSLCPFEFGLDLSLECDVIIGDYNYAFDPRAKLKRYFLERSDSALLIDEAHNLPDRAREMFSAAVSRKGMAALRREIGRISRRGALYKAVAKLARTLKALEEPGERRLADFPDDVWADVDAFLEEAAPAMGEAHPYGELLAEQFFAALAFQSARETQKKVPEDFACLCQPPEVRLYCLHPAEMLRACYAQTKAQVLFSATLQPMEYFADVCGLGEDVRKAAVPSPFPPERMRAILRPLSTRFRDREATAQQVAETIAAMADARPDGNYIAFFPSYAYLRLVQPLLEERLPRAQIIPQQGGMNEEARTAFLALFTECPKGILLALAVMGGLFGEGVDLPGNRLSGAAIVGAGLPQIGLPREALRTRYGENGDGFRYAYIYPGMARVAQAGGRVIRSDSDTGTVLLIDDRFLHPPYRALLPRHWNVRIKRSIDDIRSDLQAFWSAFPEDLGSPGGL